MTEASAAAAVWRPAPDDALTWFRPERGFPDHPRPLERTLHLEALRFGLSQALVSLYFPLHEIRMQLVGGRLYLAVAPLESAERNLEERFKRLNDSAIRFTRSVKRAWERDLRREAESYNEWIARVNWSSAPGDEAAGSLRRLRRMRANQWFAIVRGVIAPMAMLQQRSAKAANRESSDQSDLGERLRESDDVLREAHEVLQQGDALIASAIDQIGRRLEKARSLGGEDDIYWLEWMEVRETLEHPTDRFALIAQRKAVAAQDRNADAPASIGPELPPDAPRMHLVREVLALLA